MPNQKNYLLQFDFSHDGINMQAIFKDPLHIITTTRPEKVFSCIEKIDQAVRDGYYVAGYFAYEAASSIYPNTNFQHNDNYPLLWFGVFKEKYDGKPINSHSFHVSSWKPNLSQQEYHETFNYILEQINKGDTNQVNYTIQMSAKFSGDAYSYYKRLKSAQEANYSAYLSLGEYSILSPSPELFFHLKERKITTKPMKGTASRGNTYEEDRVQARWLHNSIKNREENMLSVKLMEKELSKLAKPHSIKIPKKFEIEQYPTLFQMTSTVTATLKDNIDTKKLFKTLFPASSITGAPKEKTIRIINETEKAPRNVYCGAIGYFTPHKEAIFNVPIRTVFIDHTTNKATYGVGGAIVKDSTKEEEYEEIITKAKILEKQPKEFQLLETIGLIDGEYIVLDNHLKRLKQSASYFNFIFHEEEVRKILEEILTENQRGSFIVRVLLEKNGEITTDLRRLEKTTNNQVVTFASKPIQKDNPFLYHKTTERTVYDRHTKDDVFDVILWNEQREVTEFTKGNLVIKQSDKLFTPPVSSGLLPGTFRKHLLDKQIIKEKTITKKDIQTAEDIYFINSVRKWIKVHLK